MYKNSLIRRVAHASQKQATGKATFMPEIEKNIFFFIAMRIPVLTKLRKTSSQRRTFADGQKMVDPLLKGLPLSVGHARVARQPCGGAVEVLLARY